MHILFFTKFSERVIVTVWPIFSKELKGIGYLIVRETFWCFFGAVV